MSTTPITVPPPDELRRRIADRSAEILELRRLLRLSVSAQRAAALSHVAGKAVRDAR